MQCNSAKLNFWLKIVKKFTSGFYNAMQLRQIEFLAENRESINATLVLGHGFVSSQLNVISPTLKNNVFS